MLSHLVAEIIIMIIRIMIKSMMMILMISTKTLTISQLRSQSEMHEKAANDGQNTLEGQLAS